MKKQVVIIHGGDPFETYEDWFSFLKVKKLNFEKIKNPRGDWKDDLQNRLVDSFDLIVPQMPNKQSAKYKEWTIWFEKLIPHLESEVILVGHSLGGIFLTKYLSENEFPKIIAATFLVAAPYDDKDVEYSLADFNLKGDLSKFQTQGGKIFLYHSKDDPVVPFRNVEKYQENLPNAIVRIFEDRNHFNQEELPEIVDDIKSI